MKLLHLLLLPLCHTPVCHSLLQCTQSHRPQLRPNIGIGTPRLAGPRSTRRDAEDGATSECWTLPRLYVGPRRGSASRDDAPIASALAPGVLVRLSSEQTHHLTSVLRLFKKRSRGVRLFDGENGEWLATVRRPSEPSAGSGRRGRAQKDACLVAECTRQLRAQDREEDRPWLLLAPLHKKARMKMLVEKCTELGAGRIVPVTSDHVTGGALTALLGSGGGRGGRDALYAEENRNGVLFDKLEVQAIEAAEQCERLSVPLITTDLPVARPGESAPEQLWDAREVVTHWCRAWEEGLQSQAGGEEGAGALAGRTLLICRERADGGAAVPVLQALREAPRAAFLVGPEGGWSAEEGAAMDAACARYGAGGAAPVRSVSLGASVLRAETAGLLAIGAWALSAP